MVICSFEEGLKYLPISTDLWLHYSIWKTEHGTPEEARNLFERATQACGKVYTSNLLWDKYLDFEKTQKNYEGMEKIFWQLLSFPTNKLYEYYTRFKNFIDSHYKDSLDTKEESRKKKLDEVILAYEKVVIENNKKKVFEQAIKRSNFSTKPLDQEQIQNWRKYLEHEEKENNFEKIKLLYERCIVPACYYPEFWIRYAKYLERSVGVDASRELYNRANKKFLFRKPELFVSQGYFEETHNNIEEARRLYKHAYEQVAPGLLDGVISHIRLERRQKNYNEVDRLFKYAETITVDSENSGNYLYVVSEYARFHHFVLEDLNKAIEIYENSLPKTGDQKSIYYIYINALNCLNDIDLKLNKIKNAYELGLRTDSLLPGSDKLELWVSYMDFVRNSWKNSEDIKDIEARFRKNFHHQNLLTVDFKNKCKIKRMKRSDLYEYPEPIKKMNLT